MMVSQMQPAFSNAEETYYVLIFGGLGLHFGPAGYQVLFDELMRLIEQLWPDEMPEKLPFVLPPWDDAGAWLE